MKSLTVTISDDDIKILRKLVDMGLYTNLTDCIRSALREYLWKELENLK